MRRISCSSYKHLRIPWSAYLWNEYQSSRRTMSFLKPQNLIKNQQAKQKTASKDGDRILPSNGNSVRNQESHFPGAQPHGKCSQKRMQRDVSKQRRKSFEFMEGRSTESTLLHPCVVQSPGGVCLLDASSSNRCPYRNAPREICLNFLKHGICNTERCPWVHADVSAFYTNLADRSKVSLFLPHTAPNNEGDVTTFTGSQKPTFAQIAQICHDVLLVWNTLAGTPGHLLRISDLQALLDKQVNMKPEYLTFLVSLFPSLLGITDFSKIYWKGGRFENPSLKKSSHAAIVRFGALKGLPPASVSLPHVSLKNPFQSTSSTQENIDSFTTFHSDTGVSMSEKLRIKNPSDCQKPTSNEPSSSTWIQAFYEAYWNVLKDCESWHDAWQHLKNVIFLQSQWEDAITSHCKPRFWERLCAPGHVVRHIVTLFSSIIHKWQYQSILAQLQTTHQAPGRFPGLLSHYDLRCEDISAFARMYPFRISVRVEDSFADCSSYLPRQLNWLAEVILSSHDGVLTSSHDTGYCQKGEFSSPAYFLVNEEDIFLFHEFFSDLLARSMDMYRDTQAASDQKKVVAVVQNVFKYYLLSCLHLGKIRLSLKRIQSVLSHAQNIPLDDLGYAIILKTLCRAQKRVTLWKMYSRLIKSQKISSKAASNQKSRIESSTATRAEGNTNPRVVTATSNHDEKRVDEPYLPISTQVMLRFACQTIDDISYVAKEAFNHAFPPTLHRHMPVEHELSVKSISLVQSSLCPVSSRLRLVRSAVERADKLNETAFGAKIFLEYIEWVTEEVGYGSHMIQMNIAPDTSQKRYRFRSRSEDILALGGFLCNKLRRVHRASRELADLEKWLTNQNPRSLVYSWTTYNSVPVVP